MERTQVISPKCSPCLCCVKPDGQVETWVVAAVSVVDLDLQSRLQMLQVSEDGEVSHLDTLVPYCMGLDLLRLVDQDCCEVSVI